MTLFINPDLLHLQCICLNTLIRTFYISAFNYCDTYLVVYFFGVGGQVAFIHELYMGITLYTKHRDHLLIVFDER